MASRRLRRTIEMRAKNLRLKYTHIIVSPLANDYADYLTTFEEYQEQRYEAASNIFGPNTLEAVQYHMEKMLGEMSQKPGIKTLTPFLGYIFSRISARAVLHIQGGLYIWTTANLDDSSFLRPKWTTAIWTTSIFNICKF